MQRLFVGDVQGCAHELGEIVRRARECFGGEFELWCVGDLVNRGPDNRGVLQLVRTLMDEGRAHTVLGNHDLALLLTYAGLRPVKAHDSFGELLAAPDAADWVDWLSRQPLVIEGTLGSLQRPFLMLHGAAHPEWDVRAHVSRARAIEARIAGADAGALRELFAAPETSDDDRDVLARLTRCRSVSLAGDWSSKAPVGGARAWHAVWRERGHDYAVVYGHWAAQGLHCEELLRGLDTGCVHHGRGRDGDLTAWLPDARRADPFALPDESFWQVRAQRPYYAELIGETLPQGIETIR